MAHQRRLPPDDDGRSPNLQKREAKPPATAFAWASFELSDALHERLKIAAVREKRPMRVLAPGDTGRLTRLRGMVQLLADAGQQEEEVAVTEETGLLGIARLAMVGLTDNGETLLAVPASSYRCEPHWGSDRAAGLRRRWRGFVERALEM